MLGRVALVGFKVDVGIVVLLVVLLDSRLILDSPLKSISRGLSSCNPSSSMKRKKIPFFSFFNCFYTNGSLCLCDQHFTHFTVTTSMLL